MMNHKNLVEATTSARIALDVKYNQMFNDLIFKAIEEGYNSASVSESIPFGLHILRNKEWLEKEGYILKTKQKSFINISWTV